MDCRHQNGRFKTARARNYNMPKKGNRSKRRRPRKGFPYRVVGYLDRSTQELVSKAAEKVGENISTFVAKAVKNRAEDLAKIDRPSNQTR